MKLALTAFSTLLIILLAAGCSDDDCADCPELAVPAGIVNGSVFVTPGVGLDAVIIPQGSVSPSLDSMHLGDSLLVLMRGFMPWPSEGMGGEVYWEIEYYGETGPDYMYEPGDTAHIDFWGNGRSATCDVVVLDPTMAAAEIISPTSEADTVAPGESVTVYWSRIDHVQYYGVALGIMDAEAEMPGPIIFDWTTDTAYTVDPELYPDSLMSLGVTIMPFTGPNPTTAGNVTGGWLSGRITSFGIMGYTSVMGWVEYPFKKSVANECILSQWTPAQIIEEIYRQARQ